MLDIESACGLEYCCGFCLPSYASNLIIMRLNVLLNRLMVRWKVKTIRIRENPNFVFTEKRFPTTHTHQHCIHMFKSNPFTLNSRPLSTLTLPLNGSPESTSTLGSDLNWTSSRSDWSRLRIIISRERAWKKIFDFPLHEVVVIAAAASMDTKQLRNQQIYQSRIHREYAPVGYVVASLCFALTNVSWIGDWLISLSVSKFKTYENFVGRRKS